MTVSPLNEYKRSVRAFFVLLPAWLLPGCASEVQPSCLTGVEADAAPETRGDSAMAAVTGPDLGASQPTIVSVAAGSQSRIDFEQPDVFLYFDLNGEEVRFQSQSGDAQEDFTFALSSEQAEQFQAIVNTPGFVQFFTGDTSACRADSTHASSSILARFSDGEERTVSNYGLCKLNNDWDLGQLGYQVTVLGAFVGDLADAFIDCPPLENLTDGLPNPIDGLTPWCTNVAQRASIREFEQCEAGEIAQGEYDCAF